MRVLSILNFTNIDDYNSDSGYIFNYILAEQFILNQYDFDVILPVQLRNHTVAFKGEIYYANLGVTKYEARFSFDWKGILDILIENRPDYILVNECELALPLRAMLITCALQNIKIISYCHYPALHVGANDTVKFDISLNDAGLGRRIVSDILQAVNVSDYFFIQSQFAQKLLYNAANDLHIPLEKEIHVVPPPYDPFLYVEKSSKGHKVIYNHRLYESYGADQFLKLVHKLSDCSFLVTNPMAHRSQARFFSSTFPEKIIDLLRKEGNVSIVDGSESRLLYKEYLSQGYIGIAPYRPACVWSMAAIDCIGMNIPVIAPDIASYQEFIPVSLRYGQLEEQIDLINRLKNNRDFYETSLQESRKLLSVLSPEMVFNRIHSIIKERGSI